MVMPSHEDTSVFKYGKGYFIKFLQLYDLQFCSVSSNRLSSDRKPYLGFLGSLLELVGYSVSSILYCLVSIRG